MTAMGNAKNTGSADRHGRPGGALIRSKTDGGRSGQRLTGEPANEADGGDGRRICVLMRLCPRFLLPVVS